MIDSIRSPDGPIKIGETLMSSDPHSGIVPM
jgi:hypothetical protein